MKIMSVARSDMSRQRRVTIKGQDWPKDFNVAKALGLRQGRRGVVVP